MRHAKFDACRDSRVWRRCIEGIEGSAVLQSSCESFVTGCILFKKDITPADRSFAYGVFAVQAVVALTDFVAITSVQMGKAGQNQGAT